MAATFLVTLTKCLTETTCGGYRNHISKEGIKAGLVQFVVVGLALWHLYILMEPEAKSGSGDGGGLYPLQGYLQWPTSFRQVLYPKSSTEPSAGNANCLDPNHSRDPLGSLNPDLLYSPDVIPHLITLMSQVLISTNAF